MSKAIVLPSGKVATRFFNAGAFHWQLPTVGTAEWVTLGAADIRALYESLQEEQDRPKAAPLVDFDNVSIDALCRCGHVADVHDVDDQAHGCNFPRCACEAFALHKFPCP